MSPHEQKYHELCLYTLAHAQNDASFIHQHVVDAFAAQTAGDDTKPIGLVFALMGLYLHIECGLTGRQVQQVHMQLAKRKQAWPAFALPQHRGSISVSDVMAESPGPGRDRAIDVWCGSVWEALKGHREAIHDLLAQHGICVSARPRVR